MLDATRPYLLQEELRKKLLDETGGAPADLMQQAQQAQSAAIGQVDPAASPARAPAAPQGPVYPEDLSDAAMAKAYTAKRGAETMGQMMNASALINRGFGGSAPLNAGDAFVRGADDKVNEIASRRAGLGQEQKIRDEQHQREMQRTAEDPNSPTNQLRATLLGRFYKDDPQVQPFLSKLNPAQEPSLEDLVKSDVAIKKATKPAGGSAAMTQDAADAVVAHYNAQFGLNADQQTELKRVLTTVGDSKMQRDATQAIVSGRRIEASKETAKDNREATNARFDRGLTAKKDAQVADDVSEIGKQINDRVAGIKTSLGKVLPLISKAKAKYGGDIPGTGLIEDFIGKGRLTQGFLNSPEEKEIRGWVDSMNILNRTDITGAAFGEKEANDLKNAYADLLTGTNLEQSLQRLQTKIDAAVKKAVGTKRPEAQAEFFKRFPEYMPEGYKAPAAPQAPPLSGPPVKEPGGMPAEGSATDKAARWLTTHQNDPMAAQVREKLRKAGIEVK